jgi:type I restriction enzyme, S subunit
VTEVRTFHDLFAVPIRNGVYIPKEFRGSGYFMLNMGELFAFPRIPDMEMERVQLSDIEVEKSVLNPGDLLFARRSLVLSGAGKCSIFVGSPNTTTFESSIIRVRLDKNFASPEFYFYFFNSPQGRSAIESIAEQVAVAGIRGSDLANLLVPYPSIETQRAITHILGSLDDKIELNRRMNTTLEATAHALFQSWFVDFDPVHAKARSEQPSGMDAATAAFFPDHFEDSPLGPIPAGWQAKRIPEAMDLNPQRRLTQGQIAPYLAMENMPTHSARAINWIYRDVGSGTKFMNGDVLVARITPCLENGKTAYLHVLKMAKLLMWISYLKAKLGGVRLST